MPADVAPLTTPTIYTARRAALVAPWNVRFIAAGVAIACGLVLYTAASLQPSPTGVGSHRTMGLQGCQLLERTGMPCPSCGMTTSFTWFVRGNFLASFYVQPMGMVLAAMAAAAIWIGAYVAITGKPIYRIANLLPVRPIAIGLLSFAILAWGWKIFLRFKGLDGWGG